MGPSLRVFTIATLFPLALFGHCTSSAIPQQPQSNTCLAPTMTSVTYSSTRGGQTGLDFRSVVMQGLARDRGLFVPDEIPSVTPEEIESWRSLSYPDMAVEVISKFVKEDQVPAEKLKDIIHRSCAAFRSPEVTPVKKIGELYVLVRKNKP